jgi:hypothetical protein
MQMNFAEILGDVAPEFIQRQLEAGVRLSRSKSLDRPAGLFPASFDQGGRSAAASRA